MSLNFEELDFVPTPMGDVSLRRQRLMMLGGREIYEVKLGEEYLMSSLFTAVEEALARLALAELKHPAPNVVVGGLGLGYTAATVLEDKTIHSLTVVEALPPVIDWHRRGLVPLGPVLMNDSRCRIVCGDFFKLGATGGPGFDPEIPHRRFHAILLDIDHSPRHLLHPRHAAFYNVAGLQALRRHLLPDGVFGMWSDSPVDPAFLADLQTVFGEARAETIEFANPFLGENSASIVYIAHLPADRL